MATILSPNAQPRAVKNLGWLLRNWQSVGEFGFTYGPNGMVDGNLWAKCHDGRVYLTDFVCLSVAWRWLNRPIFRELRVTLSYPDKSDYAWRYFTIGNNEWKRLQKLADHGSRETLRQFYKELGLTE